MVLYIYWFVSVYIVSISAISDTTTGPAASAPPAVRYEQHAKSSRWKPPPARARGLATWTNTLPSSLALQLEDADGLQKNAMGPSALEVSAGQPIHRLALLAPAGDKFVANGARMRMVLSVVQRPDAESGACVDPETSLSDYAISGNFASPEGAPLLDSDSDRILYANVSAQVPLVFKVGGSFRVCYSHDGTFTNGHVDIVQATIEVIGAYSSCKSPGCLGETPAYCYVRKRAHNAVGSCVASFESHGRAGKVKFVSTQDMQTSGRGAFSCTSSPATVLCTDGWADGTAACDGGGYHLKSLPDAAFPGQPGINQTGGYITLPQTVSYLLGTSFRAYALAACYCPAYRGCQTADSYTQQIGVIYFYASKVCTPHDAVCLSGNARGDDQDDGFTGVTMGIPWLLVVLCASSHCVGESSTNIQLIDVDEPNSQSSLQHHFVCGERPQTSLLVSPSDYSGASWCNLENLAVNESCADANARIFGGPDGFRLENDKRIGRFSRSFSKSKVLGVCFCLHACDSSRSWFQVGVVHVAPFALAEESSVESLPIRDVNVIGVLSFYLNGENVDSLGLNSGGAIKIVDSSLHFATDSTCNDTQGDPDLIPVFLKMRLTTTTTTVTTTTNTTTSTLTTTTMTTMTLTTMTVQNAMHAVNGKIKRHFGRNCSSADNDNTSSPMDDENCSNSTPDYNNIDDTHDTPDMHDTQHTHDTHHTDTQDMRDTHESDDVNDTNVTDAGEIMDTTTHSMDLSDIPNATDSVGKICSAIYVESAYEESPAWNETSSNETTTTGMTTPTFTTRTTSTTSLDLSSFIDGFSMLKGRQENCTAADPIACPGAARCCQQLTFDGKEAHYALLARTPGVRAVCYCAPPQDCAAPGAQWLLTVPLVIRGPLFGQHWEFPSYVAVTMEVVGVSLSETDVLRIAAPGESCDDHPCAAQNILIGCPQCIPLSEQVNPHIMLQPLAHNMIRCDEADSDCDFVPIVSLVANSTSLIITFAKDPALVDGDSLVLGQEVACLSSCSEDQVAAIRGVHLYGGNGVKGEYALGHKVSRFEWDNPRIWITHVEIGKPVPILKANAASWRLLNRGSVAKELMGGPGMSLPVCWSSGVNNQYSARAGLVNFVAPKRSPAHLDITARRAGVVAPVILSFTSHVTEIGELLVTSANVQLELVIRFFNLTLLRPVSLRDAITSYDMPSREGVERSRAQVHRRMNSQGFCGEWFSEMWADDVKGFPIARGCSYTPEHAGGREISIHLDPQNSLKRKCQGPQKHGETVMGECRYQLVFHAELGALAIDTPLADVYLLCRSGCGSPYLVMQWSTARARAAVAAKHESSHDDPHLTSFTVVGAHPVMNTLELVDRGDPVSPSVDFDLSVSITSRNSWTTNAIRIFLTPFALWNVDECRVTIGPSTSRLCQPRLLGLSNSSIDLDVQGALQTLPQSTELSFQLTPPRFGLGFFPTQIAAEIVSEYGNAEDDGDGDDDGDYDNDHDYDHEGSDHDQNKDFAGAVGPSFSYKVVDGFLWREPQSSKFVNAFKGAAQLFIAGRTGYGPRPFVDQVNSLMLKFVSFATVSRHSDPFDASVDLVLPHGFECLRVNRINHSEPLDPLSGFNSFAEEDVPPGWLQDAAGGSDSFEQLRTDPEICRFSLGEYQALFAGQVVAASVEFKNPSVAVPAGMSENRWSLSLRSRGLVLDSTVLMQLSHPFSTSWVEATRNESMWQGNIAVLGRMTDVFIHPSHLHASNFPENEISVFFRLAQSLQAGSFLVIDAPSGFDFLDCVVHELPTYRYDSYESGTLHAPNFQDSCVAIWWPCFQFVQPLSYPEVAEFCARSRSDLSGQARKPRDRAILNLAESLNAHDAYGFQMTVTNPTTYFIESQKRGWWLWTRDLFGDGVDGTPSAVSFNSLMQEGDNDAFQQSWSVYARVLDASIAVDGLQPYSISGRMQYVTIVFSSPSNGISDARLLAPNGYIWGPAHGTSRQICAGSVPSASLAPGDSGMLWPDLPCSVSLNIITWDLVSLVADMQYTIFLQVRVPDRTPLMGANAFYFELGYARSLVDERWGAAAMGSDAFHVQTLSNASVSSSCTVAGFHANHVCFSVRLPTAIPTGGMLRIYGMEYTANLLFRRDCEVQRCQPPVNGANPLPDDLACEFEALDGNRPQISIVPLAGWPAGFFAFKMIAHNPASPTEVRGTWVFETFAAAHGDRLDRQTIVPGFRLRRAMRSAGFLGLSSEMLTAFGGDRRLSHINQVIIRFVLDAQLAGTAPFQLQMVAPTGFIFPQVCQADVPLIPDIQYPYGWSDALAGCAGQGPVAYVAIALELKPDVEYILRVSVINPTVEAVRTQSDVGEWSLQFMDQASEPFPSFSLQMFYNLDLQRASAAYGATEMPVLLAFTPFSTVPESPNGRLVLTAPVGFRLFATSCYLKEQGGACENCVAESGEWCAQDDVCGARGGRSCASQYSSAQKERQGLAACSFQISPGDLHCAQSDDLAVLAISLDLSHGVHSTRGGFSKGRRYELTFMVTNPDFSIEGSGEWRLQSEEMGIASDHWEEMDLGEVNGFALHQAALNWSVVNPTCEAAGGAQVAIEAFLRLSQDVQADDVLEVTAPPGITWPSSSGDADCAQELSIAFPQQVQEQECPPIVEPGLMSTATTTSSGMRTTRPSTIGSDIDINGTWLFEANASDVSTDTSTTITTSTHSATLTIQRRLQGGTSVPLCKSNGCIQCVCTTRCQILLRGLHLAAGAPLRWTIVARNPMEAPNLAENFWHVAHFSKGVQLSEASSMSWYVQTQLVNAAVLLTPPAGGPRRVGSFSTIRIELTPLRAASMFELSAEIPGFDFRSSIIDTGFLVAARLQSLLVRIDLNVQQVCKVSVASVRLGNIGGPTVFTLVTYSGTGELRDKLLHFEGFRLPGTLDVRNASLQRDVPHPYLRDQNLPARTGEPAKMLLLFHVGLHVQAGSFLHVSCNSFWSLSSDLASDPRVSGGGLQVSSGLVEQLASCHVVFALNASLSPGMQYKVEVLSLPTSAASPADQWTLSVLDGGTHPVVTNDGKDLKGLLDPIAASISFDMQMGRPSPGGQLRVTFRFPSFKILPPVVDLVLVPPPGWKGPPVRGKDCIEGLQAESAHRDHTVVRNFNLASAAPIDFGTPCISDPDTKWYALVAAVRTPLDQLLAWGDGQGTVVAHMRVELRHAQMAGLVDTPIVLSFQLGQETEVGSILFSAPAGYRDLACADVGENADEGADEGYDPPRWLMKMRSLQPNCIPDATSVNGSGLSIVIDASMSAGTWTIGLIGTLPQEPSSSMVYHVMVKDKFSNLIDAAYGQPALELMDSAKWRVRDPFLALRSRSETGEYVVAVGFSVEDPVAMEGNLSISSSISALSIRAIRILLPPGLFTSIGDVKLDLVLSDALPVEEEGKRVTRGAVLLTMQAEAVVPHGVYEMQFPVDLPGEAPNDNVWSLEFCSEATCSGESVNFPLVGFSENERPVASSLNVEASHSVRRSALSRWYWMCLVLACTCGSVSCLGSLSRSAADGFALDSRMSSKNRRKCVPFMVLKDAVES